MTLIVYGSLVTFFVVLVIRICQHLPHLDADDGLWDIIGYWGIMMASGGMAIWLLGKILLAYSGEP